MVSRCTDGAQVKRRGGWRRVAGRETNAVNTHEPPPQSPHSICPNKARCIQLKATIAVWHCMTSDKITEELWNMNYPHTNYCGNQMKIILQHNTPLKHAAHSVLPNIPWETPPAYLWRGKNRPNPSHYLADAVKGGSSPGADMWTLLRQRTRKSERKRELEGIIATMSR